MPFYMRMILYALYLLIIVFVGNYFYEKLWQKSEKLALENENKMINTLNSLALARDNETGNHIIRTQQYVKLLAIRLRKMGHYTDLITDEFINLLFKAAPLHDLGKVGIPDKILLKPDKLTPKEWEVMKTHTLIGESVLNTAGVTVEINENKEYEDVISKAIKIAGGHHEKWDGSGYPRALVKDQIPLEARIMSLADMYDALVSKRSYKEAWTHEDAVNEILYKKGTHFDPLVVDAFLLEASQFGKIAEDLKD
jgi:response regulator RpfG family c-di-GMP phosphodiesterase